MSDSEHDPQIQVGESSKSSTVDESKNETVQQVFSMFKCYLEDRIDQKGKEIELRSKAEKEVIQLKYKGNQKQFELNAQVDSIFDSIQAEIPTPDHGARLQKLVKQGKELIRKRQKLIKIADRNKDAWQVVDEYESDDFAFGPDDEKRLKKAKDAVSGKRRQHDLPPKSSGKRPKIAVGDSDNQLFCGTYLANIAPVVLCYSHMVWICIVNPTITCFVCFS